MKNKNVNLSSYLDRKIRYFSFKLLDDIGLVDDICLCRFEMESFVYYVNSISYIYPIKINIRPYYFFKTTENISKTKITKYNSSCKQQHHNNLISFKPRACSRGAQDIQILVEFKELSQLHLYIHIHRRATYAQLMTKDTTSVMQARIARCSRSLLIFTSRSPRTLDLSKLSSSALHFFSLALALSFSLTCAR